MLAPPGGTPVDRKAAPVPPGGTPTGQDSAPTTRLSLFSTSPFEGFDVNKRIFVVANVSCKLVIHDGVGLPTPLDKIGLDNNDRIFSVLGKVAN